MAEFADEINDEFIPTRNEASNSANPPSATDSTPVVSTSNTDKVAPSTTNEQALAIPTNTTESFVRPAQAAGAPVPRAAPDLTTTTDSMTDADNPSAPATAVTIPDVQLAAEENASAPSAETALPETDVAPAPPVVEAPGAPGACPPSSEDIKTGEIEAAPAPAVTEISGTSALATDEKRGTKRILEEVYHDALDGTNEAGPSKAARNE